MSLFILASLAALTASRKVPDPRIVNGIPIPASKYPWMVSLRTDYIDDRWKAFDTAFCGASLIQSSPPVVLTAAHCINIMSNGTHMTDWEGDAYRLYADVNRTYAQNGLKSLETVAGDAYQTLEWDINSIVLHPTWNGYTTEGYDIALIFFDNIGANQAVDLDEADLPSLPTQLSDTEACCVDEEALVAIGYGRNETNGSATATLEETTLHYVTLDDCMAALQTMLSDQTVMCAVGDATDTCQGDSGGPLVRMVGDTPKIMGLTSWGYGCALPGLPGVYTSTAHYAQWITDTISLRLGGVSVRTTEASIIDDISDSTTPSPTTNQGDSGNRVFYIYGAIWSLALLFVNL